MTWFQDKANSAFLTKADHGESHGSHDMIPPTPEPASDWGQGDIKEFQNAVIFLCMLLNVFQMQKKHHVSCLVSFLGEFQKL